MDDSSWLATLAFFAGGRQTDFLGREVFAPSVVGGLFVSYLR